MIVGALVIVFIAEPFIVFLFGEKYIPATVTFQALVLSYIPFIIAVPPVTAIIYIMKKTIYIGLYSIFQLLAVFSLNLIFIPRYGSIGPTITLGITNLILAILTWMLVINYFNKK
jgi:O-antigen/teichoic acid export membrane protein